PDQQEPDCEARWRAERHRGGRPQDPVQERGHCLWLRPHGPPARHRPHRRRPHRHAGRGMTVNQDLASASAVEGPVPGDVTLLLGNFDLGAHGYVREEYFLSGTATSYRRGATAVEPAETADYRTRFVVC